MQMISASLSLAPYRDPPTHREVMEESMAPQLEVAPGRHAEAPVQLPKGEGGVDDVTLAQHGLDPGGKGRGRKEERTGADAAKL